MRGHVLEALTIAAGDQATRRIKEAGPHARFALDPLNVGRCRGGPASLSFFDSDRPGVACCVLQRRMPSRRHAARPQNECKDQCNTRSDDRRPEPEKNFEEETTHDQLPFASDLPPTAPRRD